MKKFFKKIKNNKAIGNGILGMIIAFFVIMMTALIVDIFISSIVQREMQNHVEMGQLYGLVKAVDVNRARNYGELVVDERLAETYFKRHFNEMIPKYGSFITELETKEGSKEFINVHKGKTSDYMYADGVERTFIAASSHIEFYPRRYFRVNKPVKINAVTRIFVDMDDTQDYESNIVDEYRE